MAKHFAYLFSEDAEAQAGFYTRALGGEITSIKRLGELPNATEETKDKVIHLSLVAAGVTFLMSDMMNGPVIQGNAVQQCLEFESEAEAQDAFDKLADGGTVKHPLQKEFWGAMFGQLDDKFGVQWMITTAGPGN
ncbi:VOC family protein [Paenibacillus sp. J31TS4]|uniref:VOC family protein n=1 Tax=Paenibacillus sp. J31TS4 TaxID=2807195 RepID=UPI001B039359|nr:VOC family protein [Paenibacillus sp. J31TS4]GIP41111.1 VOC family protein [Paenibacillus sp. J31TS4]